MTKVGWYLFARAGLQSDFRIESKLRNAFAIYKWCGRFMRVSCRCRRFKHSTNTFPDRSPLSMDWEPQPARTGSRVLDFQPQPAREEMGQAIPPWMSIEFFRISALCPLRRWSGAAPSSSFPNKDRTGSRLANPGNKHCECSTTSSPMELDRLAWALA